MNTSEFVAYAIKILRMALNNLNDLSIAMDTNLCNSGSNTGRLYTHTDLKLIKNGGGSAW